MKLQRYVGGAISFTALIFLSACGYITGSVRVRQSAVPGWATVDQFNLITSDRESVTAAGTDSTGSPWVVGTDYAGSGDYATVRMSNDKGSTWSLVDRYQSSSTSNSTGTAVAFDGSGGVYVLIRNISGTDLIRKSTTLNLATKTFPSESMPVESGEVVSFFESVIKKN